MAPDFTVSSPGPAADDRPETRYDLLGDEVAFVLASARSAAADLRRQAEHYAEALLVGTRQECAGLVARAEEDSETLRAEARAQATAHLRTTRQQVLAILEAARARVDTFESAAEAASGRRNELVAAETVLEARITDAVEVLQGQLGALRTRRSEEEGVLGPDSGLDDALQALLDDTDGVHDEAVEAESAGGPDEASAGGDVARSDATVEEPPSSSVSTSD